MIFDSVHVYMPKVCYASIQLVPLYFYGPCHVRLLPTGALGTAFHRSHFHLLHDWSKDHLLLVSISLFFRPRTHSCLWWWHPRANLMPRCVTGTNIHNIPRDCVVCCGRSSVSWSSMWDNVVQVIMQLWMHEIIKRMLFSFNVSLSPLFPLLSSLSPLLSLSSLSFYDMPMHGQMALQLGYIYSQIISVLTQAQLSRIFTQHTNFDLRRLLGGRSFSFRTPHPVAVPWYTSPFFSLAIFVLSFRFISQWLQFRVLSCTSLSLFCGIVHSFILPVLSAF